MNEKNQDVLKQSESSIVKKMTTDEVRAWLRRVTTTADPKCILQKVQEAIKGGISNLDKASKEEYVLINEAVTMMSHERHYLLAESVVDERWRPMIMDLANCIQEEYNCTTNSEIALAGLAASAYYRSLRAGRKMNALLERTEIGTIGVQLMGQVSKELDRAERQYLSAIEVLRCRRQPQINVKVQTKAAFFGENQTFNADSQTSYETNDPQ